MAHVLIIDDEAPIRSNLVRFLVLEGHRASEAADGETGIAMASREHTDLVFCDVMMPGISGFDVLERFQANAQLRGIPFIFLSASAEPEQLENATKRGAAAYVVKPFNLRQLQVLLETHLPRADHE